MDDDLDLKALLNAKRLAFLAALHPRAGNLLFQTLVGKDIAKMIARDYVTLKSQTLLEYPIKKRVVRPKEVNTWVMTMGTPMKNKFHGLSIYFPRFYKPSLSYVQRSGLTVQTPKLRIAFDVRSWEECMMIVTT